MTLKPRTMIAAAAALTVTGSIAAALTLAGSTTSAAAEVVHTAGIAADVEIAPTVVLPAPVAVVRPAAAVIHAHALQATVKRVHVTVTAPKPATKPAARPVTTTPVPVAKPVATAPKPIAPAPAPAPSTTVRDDYPYRTATTNDNDEWGFTKRQCVSFAAFRLAQHGNAISNNDNWGSALTWDDAAKRLGKTVTSTPKVGAIAQWNAGESSSVYSASGAKQGTFSAGSYGHVGYVAAVYSDGSVLVEQYNLGGDRSYSSMRMTAPRYILV